MSKAFRDGERSAMSGYDRNPYTREPEHSEWQSGYDSQMASEQATRNENARLAQRSIADMLDEGDLAEALRKIADHLGILYDKTEA